MGIFSSLIKSAYAPNVPAAIVSPYSPQGELVKLVADDVIGGLRPDAIMTRDIARRIPGVNRANGIVCAMFARVPFYVMNDAVRDAIQPGWLTNSGSGQAPYHSKYGVADDMFWDGKACVGFTADMSDMLHIPNGLWQVNPRGYIEVDEARVPEHYRAKLVMIPVGFGFNGVMNDGIDTLRQARLIETAYQDRLDNPIPLTILSVPKATWDQWTPDERKSYRDQWVEGRRKGGVALKVAEFGVEMPGQVQVDLYETGRNAVRLDIANHTAMPAGLLEGLRQGGSGGTEMHYTSEVGGAHRSELWDFGLPSRFVHAFEARLSLDDVVAPGLSVRADLSAEFASPNPTTNPTRED